MAQGYSSAGVLSDAYGAAFAGGQRFFTWTNDAFNPVAWGVSTRNVPTSAPELLTGGSMGSGGYGLSNLMTNVSTWNPLQSPVVWVLVGLIVLIPVYHKWEYGK